MYLCVLWCEIGNLDNFWTVVTWAFPLVWALLFRPNLLTVSRVNIDACLHNDSNVHYLKKLSYKNMSTAGLHVLSHHRFLLRVKEPTLMSHYRKRLLWRGICFPLIIWHCPITPTGAIMARPRANRIVQRPTKPLHQTLHVGICNIHQIQIQPKGSWFTPLIHSARNRVFSFSPYRPIS